MTLEQQILAMTAAARAASETMGDLDTPTKNAWLLRVSERLQSARETILEANRLDVREAERAGVPAPLARRLQLSDAKWRDMIQGLHDVAALADPVGQVVESRRLNNGLLVGRMRIPLGVIGIIYEARPNVTVDAAALCVKSGNAVILRGGSEAFQSNRALGAELCAACSDVGLPEHAVTVFPTTDRSAIDILLTADRHVDLIIPRGGPGLIQKVTQTSTIPVIKHDAGVCHIFIDADASGELALSIVRESKIRQMAVCNSVETLLCHRDAAASTLPQVLDMLHHEGVEIRGCRETCRIFSHAVPATEQDWRAEFLAPILAVRIVPDLNAAIEHIRRFGSNHTEVIITNNYANSQIWQRRVNSSTVGVNCSTAFADGFSLGLGAEIGISTSKLHAYGPMGLEGLTTLKFVLTGDGQLRG